MNHHSTEPLLCVVLDFGRKDVLFTEEKTAGLPMGRPEWVYPRQGLIGLYHTYFFLGRVVSFFLGRVVSFFLRGVVSFS